MNNWSMKFKNTIYNSTKKYQIPRKNLMKTCKSAIPNTKKQS